MPRKKQTDAEQPELIAEEAAEYIVSPDEEALREEYRRRLAEMLKDPEFRKIEGFPIGEDDAILALSDPPYYTACPNPFLNEIVEKWRSERAALRDELGLPSDEPAGSKYVVRENMPTKNYHREPFAADVSEGKNDPIYNAHSYHTKVPHKAIMRYILHYTDPGDVVLDGFCGTGMTGVAAQLSGDKKTVESLGYTVKDGIIYDSNKQPISRIGARRAVLADLSPAATYISYNYNTPVNVQNFERESERVLKSVISELGWMDETWHPNCDDEKRIKGNINYIIYSDVYSCPSCGAELVFWDVAVNHQEGKVLDQFECVGCGELQSKSTIERVWVTYFDKALGKVIKFAKQVPVQINYSVGTKTHKKSPDSFDLQLQQKIADVDFDKWYPTNELPDGYNTRQPIESHGAKHVHQFYPRNSLIWLSMLYEKTYGNRVFWATFSLLNTVSKLYRYVPKKPGYKGQGGGLLTGTLYIPALIRALSVHSSFRRSLQRLALAIKQYKSYNAHDAIISANSSTKYQIPSESIDYIFVDPPFGGNLMYSEINFIWESWLKVQTNNRPEAIVNKVQGKNINDYQNLMEDCFREFYRLLKSGRWITIEFHNSQNSIWNSIQEALLSAGFVVADVRTLDKIHQSFKQITSASAVKQDLVISAYKPTTIFEKKFISEGGSIQGAWDFVKQHLEYLPLPSLLKGVIETLPERQPYLLYDRMVAFHIQRGLTVPLSAPEFYQGLSQRFLEREGMVFTAAQAAAYDKLRLQAERVEQLALFVTDESSARQWLRQELEHEPKTYGDLQPKFVQQLHQSKYEDLPELKVILEQAFLQDDKGRWYVPDPERAADLEKLRQNALLREFNEYRKGKGRLKVFRSEAVRAGFSNAWREREYDVIVEIAERMPESVLQEDQQLLMYYHNAGLRQSSEPRQENLL